MCGIFGYILKNYQKENSTLIKKGIYDLSSRGPDFNDSVVHSFLDY